MGFVAFICFLIAIAIVGFFVSFLTYRLEEKRWLFFVLFPLTLVIGLETINFIFTVLMAPNYEGPSASIVDGFAALSAIPLIALSIACLACLCRFKNIPKNWMIYTSLGTFILLVLIYQLTSRVVTVLVLDKNNIPISGATLRWENLESSLNFCWNEKGKKRTNKEGRVVFRVSKLEEVRCQATKEGYYFCEDSRANLVTQFRQAGRELLIKNSPAVLKLVKIGEAEPLAEIDGRQYDVLKNGEPIEINLLTKQVGRGHLKIECWIEPISHEDHFNWRYRISVPGGGLADRKGEFDFEAPLEGYRLVDEFGMNATDGKWTSNFEKQYFLKLHDGNYARVNIDFHPETGNDWNFISLKSYLNPRGSRNLEFDENKIIKPK